MTIVFLHTLVGAHQGMLGLHQPVYTSTEDVFTLVWKGLGKIPKALKSFQKDPSGVQARSLDPRLLLPVIQSIELVMAIG